MDTARVIQVIETKLLLRGKGTDDSPFRVITQYWSLDGELLAEVDPYIPDRMPQVNPQSKKKGHRV